MSQKEWSERPSTAPCIGPKQLLRHPIPVLANLALRHCTIKLRSFLQASTASGTSPIDFIHISQRLATRSFGKSEEVGSQPPFVLMLDGSYYFLSQIVSLCSGFLSAEQLDGLAHYDQDGWLGGWQD